MLQRHYGSAVAYRGSFLVVDEAVGVDDRDRHSGVLRERGVFLVAGEVVCLLSVTTHRGLQVVALERPTSLADDLDRKVPLVVGVPAEFVAGLNPVLGFYRVATRPRDVRRALSRHRLAGCTASGTVEGRLALRTRTNGRRRRVSRSHRRSASGRVHRRSQRPQRPSGRCRRSRTGPRRPPPYRPSR